MTRISVIIPTYDRPDVLPGAVESARAAGTDVEIIVVDDASIDDTREVCRGLKDIKYVRLERNQGVAGARNVGILASTGKYVAFLDDDDLRLPGSLDLQADALEANPESGFVCGAMVMADQDYQTTGEVFLPGQASGDVFWELLELDFPVMPLSTLIRKECLLRVGLLNQHLGGIDDWDIFVRIAELYPVLIIDQPVGLYRRPTPSSRQGSSAQSAQLLRAARHQLHLLKLPRALAATSTRRRITRRRTINRIADTLLWSAARRLPEGEFGFALRNTLAALHLNPLRAVRPRAYRKLASHLIGFTKPQRA
ncbi:MAG: glycosyltransferase [Acidobacteriota bacterium]|nr:glycosyltransferase [Acidobacteriota bacterium]